LNGQQLRKYSNLATKRSNQMSNEPYIITGATGNIGKVLSEILLRNGHQVRVIGRSEKRLQSLVDQGAVAAVGDLENTAFLTGAFEGAKAVFAMIPPSFGAEDFRKYQGQISDSLVTAIKESGVKHVVALSSWGAHLPDGTGPISGLYDFEQKLNQLDDVNVQILRPGYFMENLFQSIPLIQSMGVNGSAVIGDLELPMIAARDIAAVAANALEDSTFNGRSVQELLGPRQLSMEEATLVIGKAIGKEELNYMQFDYSNVKQVLLGAGASDSLADAYVEMTQWINSGYRQPGPTRTPANTTPTTIEDFATVFAAAYKGAAAQAA
jgi:uncharacterized protein YbjT (DUF2867 family)